VDYLRTLPFAIVEGAILLRAPCVRWVLDDCGVVGDNNLDWVSPVVGSAIASVLQGRLAFWPSTPSIDASGHGVHDVEVEVAIARDSCVERSFGPWRWQRACRRDVL
jgi:hypothetical protein